MPRNFNITRQQQEKFSPQQAEAIKSIVDSSNYSILKAVAGSGKTHTLVGIATRLYGNVTAMTYMKSNQLDLQNKLPNHWNVKTFHSMYYQVLANLGFPLRGNMAGYKYSSLTGKVVRSHHGFPAPRQMSDEQIAIYDVDHRALTNLVQFILRTGTDHTNPGRIKNMIDLYGLPVKSYFLKEAIRIVEQGMADFRKRWSFDDLGYFIKYSNLVDALPKFETIMVDEFQDTTTLQMSLLPKMLEDGGRIICAGDPRQSIMGFAGALPESMEKAAAHWDADTYDLTWTFRCPPAITDFVQREGLHSDIESAPGLTGGKVVDNFEKTMDLVLYLEPGDVCMFRSLESRHNKIPASVLASLLSSCGKPFGMIGSTLTYNYGRFNRIFKWDDDFSRASHQLDEYARNLLDEGVTSDEVMGAIKFIKAQIEKGVDSTLRLKLALENIESQEARPDRVNISTVHKQKGQTHGRSVAVNYRTDFPPSPSDFGPQEESNISYVQCTRASKELAVFRV